MLQCKGSFQSYSLFKLGTDKLLFQKIYTNVPWIWNVLFSFVTRQISMRTFQRYKMSIKSMQFNSDCHFVVFSSFQLKNYDCISQNESSVGFTGCCWNELCSGYLKDFVSFLVKIFRDPFRYFRRWIFQTTCELQWNRCAKHALPRQMH